MAGYGYCQHTIRRVVGVIRRTLLSRTRALQDYSSESSSSSWFSRTIWLRPAASSWRVTDVLVMRNPRVTDHGLGFTDYGLRIRDQGSRTRQAARSWQSLQECAR